MSLQLRIMLLSYLVLDLNNLIASVIKIKQHGIKTVIMIDQCLKSTLISFKKIKNTNTKIEFLRLYSIIIFWGSYRMGFLMQP